MTPYIWTRESDVYDKEIYSIATQVEACLQRAAVDGLSVPESNIYRVQKSGVDLFAIPQLADLFKRLEVDPKLPKRIYCYTQDRMIRGKAAADIFYITTRFRYANAELVLVRQPKDLTTIAGQLTALVDGHAASEEIEKIRDRTMRGKLQRIREGKPRGFGREKYGYIRDKAAGTTYLHPEQSRILRQIGEWLLVGESMNECCRRLNSAAIPASNGGLWAVSSLRRLFDDTAYIGQAVAWRYKRDGDGRVVRRDASEHIPQPGLYEPIFTVSEWQQIHIRFLQNRGDNTRNKTRPYLLRGLIVCALCDSPCYPTTHKRWSYYRCESSHKTTVRVADRCSARSFPINELDGMVWQEVLRRLRTTAFLEDLRRQVIPDDIATANEQEISILQATEATKLAQQANLLRQLRDAPDALARLIKSELTTLQNELAAVASRKAILESEAAHQQTAAHAKLEAGQRIVAMLPHFDSLSFSKKRLLLDELGVQVAVNHPDWRVSLLHFCA